MPESVNDKRRGEFYKLHYPRWIYKDGEEPRIVQDVYSHADFYARGWSGPPKFYPEDVLSIDEQIQQTEIALSQMKERRRQMQLEGLIPKKEKEDPAPLTDLTNLLATNTGAAEETKAKEFKCSVCGKMFKSKGGMIGHMSTHKGKESANEPERSGHDKGVDETGASSV